MAKKKALKHSLDNCYYIDRTMLESNGACGASLGMIGRFLGVEEDEYWQVVVTLKALRKYQRFYEEDTGPNYNIGSLAQLLVDGNRGLPQSIAEAVHEADDEPQAFMDHVVRYFAAEDGFFGGPSRADILDEADTLGFHINLAETELSIFTSEYTALRRKLHDQGFELYKL